MKPEIKKRIEQIKKGEVPRSYKITKIGIVPNEWEEKKLGEIGIFKKGKGISGSLIIDKGFPAMMYGDIYVKYNIKFHNVDYRISKETAQKSTPIYNNDLLFTCSGETALEIGKCICYLGKETVYIGGDILALTPVKYNGLFLAYQQNIYESVKQKARLGQGYSVVHIYQNSLEKLCICSPSLQEQQKIAKILSTQDKAIELKEKLIKEKQKQKKYIMKNLLTGKIRLNGFFDEWRKVKLREVCNYKQSNITLRSLNKTRKGNFPIFDANNVYTYVDFYEMNEDYISIVKDGAGSGRLKLCKSKSSVIGTMGYISTDRENICFLYYRMCMINFKNYISGSTIPHVYFRDYRNEKIKLPSIEEQTAIANVLSIADKEIELLKKELEQEKQKKKALMQLLLTGIVRV